MANLLRRVVVQQLLPACRHLHTSSALWSERVKGHCKWFSATKGFGFITPDDNGPDVFVHQTNIVVQNDAFRSLRDGEAVEYTLEQGPDGRFRAVQVTGPDGKDPLGAAPRSRFEAGARFGEGGGSRYGSDRPPRDNRRDDFDDY